MEDFSPLFSFVRDILQRMRARFPVYWLELSEGNEAWLLLAAASLPLMLLFQLDLTLLPAEAINQSYYWGDGNIVPSVYSRFGFDFTALHQSGSVPWWNSCYANGIPWVAGGLSSHYPLYPFLLNHFRTPVALTLHILIHRAIASVAMAYFLRQVGCRRVSCLTGAIVFSLGGPTINYILKGQWDITTAMAYVPLVFAFWLKALRSRGAGWPILAGLALGTLASSGSLQISLATVVTLFFLSLVYLASHQHELSALPLGSFWAPALPTASPGEGAPVRWSDKLPMFLGLTSRYVLILAVAALVDLPELWAQLATMVDPAVRLQLFVPSATCSPLSLLTVFVGDLFDGSTIEQVWAPWSAGESRLAVTITGCLLVLIAIRTLGAKKCCLPLSGFLFALPFGLQPNFAGPLPEALRPAGCSFLFAFFFLCWLVGLGADCALEQVRHPIAKRISVVLLAALTLVCFALNYAQGGSVWWKHLTEWALASNLSDSETSLLLVGTYTRVSWTLILLAGAYAAVLSERLWLRALAFLLLAALEIFTLVFPAMTFANIGHFVAPPDMEKYILRSHPLFRIANSAEWSGKSMTAGRTEVAGTFAATPQFSQAYGLSHQVLGNYAVFPSADPNFFLREMSTRYYLTSDHSQFSGLLETKIPNGKRDSFAYEDPNPKARAGAAVNCTYSDHDLFALRNMVKGDTTPFILPTRARSLNLTGDPNARLWNLEIEPDQVSWISSCKAPTVFFLRDSYSHLWKGQVDGAPAELYPMNAGLFRAIVCPPGEHEIRMDYQPCPLWTIGFRAMFLALLVPLLALSYGLRELSPRHFVAFFRRMKLALRKPAKKS